MHKQSSPFERFLKWEAATKDTIDFKTVYVDIAGDLIAGLLLSQIIYWHLPTHGGSDKRRVRRDGHLWLVKTRDEWWAECRLTRHQVDLALKKLRERGLVETRRYRFNNAPTTHIRLLEDGFMARWDAVVEGANSDEPEFRESRNSGNRTLELPVSGHSECPETGQSLTETTTETTTESTRGAAAAAAQIDPRTRQALARANRAHGRDVQPSSSLDPPRNGRRRRTPYDTHPVQKAWLAGFGLTAGNGGESDRFAAILAAEHPDDYVLGWILEVTACVTEGRVAPEHRAGHLIQQIEAGVPLTRRAQLWLALPASVWGELVACARAAHAHHAAPPLKGLSRMARNAWPAWSRAFTSGEHARDPARHYAPRWETLPARFVGAGLAVDVEEWLEARRRALAAKEKAVERQTV